MSGDSGFVVECTHARAFQRFRRFVFVLWFGDLLLQLQTRHKSCCSFTIRLRIGWNRHRLASESPRKIDKARTETKGWPLCVC